MSGLNIKSGCCCWCVFLGSALCSCFTAHGAAPIASFGGREGCVTNVCSCSRQLLCVCIDPHAGTDVMLLESFSTDGSSQHQHSNNLTVKRRSSVTFEDQVEHSKGACLFLMPLQTTEFLESSRSSASPNTLYLFFFFFLSQLKTATQPVFKSTPRYTNPWTPSRLVWRRL